MNTDLTRYWPVLVALLYLMVFGLCTYYRIEISDFLVSLFPYDAKTSCLGVNAVSV